MEKKHSVKYQLAINSLNEFIEKNESNLDVILVIASKEVETGLKSLFVCDGKSKPLQTTLVDVMVKDESLRNLIMESVAEAMFIEKAIGLAEMYKGSKQETNII